MSSNPHYEFAKTFFLEYGCEIAEETAQYLTIQLNDEMDEAIMNRPFYWHYIKQMNGQGQPMQLTFSSHPDGEGEHLHAGTPRLHQLYQHAINKGKFTRLYEDVTAISEQASLVPWLVVNFKISFTGRQRKDTIQSIGLNLVHGTIVTNVMDSLNHLAFNPAISDYCFPLSPLIKPQSGYYRMLDALELWVNDLDHTWAEDSLQHLNKEKQLVNRFFEQQNMSEEDKQAELATIETRFKPNIAFDVINGGLFYLSQSTTANLSGNRNSDITASQASLK
ncbi:YqhG family protein [Thalassobacillus sp. CUG 92003]|uniref:YqhG family protein n=1 Tax=Thalassobacillus sp. CUG 92003 TaxID=2736641 RepID=UPI0015E75CB5|nr:YqhG family protein [Thalassobacillus sp. CUG 92003]